MDLAFNYKDKKIYYIHYLVNETGKPTKYCLRNLANSDEDDIYEEKDDIVILDDSHASNHLLRDEYFAAAKIEKGTIAHVRNSDEDDEAEDCIIAEISSLPSIDYVSVDVFDHKAQVIRKNIKWYYIWPNLDITRKIAQIVKCIEEGITLGCYVDIIHKNIGGVVTSINPFIIDGDDGNCYYDDVPIKKHIGKYVVDQEDIVYRVLKISDEGTLSLRNYSYYRRNDVPVKDVKPLPPYEENNLDFIFGHPGIPRIFFCGEKIYFGKPINVHAPFWQNDKVWLTIRNEKSLTNSFNKDLTSRVALRYMDISTKLCEKDLDSDNKKSISSLFNSICRSEFDLDRINRYQRILLKGKYNTKKSLQYTINCIDKINCETITSYIENVHSIIQDCFNTESYLDNVKQTDKRQNDLFKDVVFLTNLGTECDDRIDSVNVKFIKLKNCSIVNVCVDTKDIILHHENYTAELGKLKIDIKIQIDMNGNFKENTTVYQSENSGISTINGYCHPHVSSNGDPCLGEHDETYYGSLTNGNVINALDILLGILNTYNYRSPYAQIQEWDDDCSSCYECGEICHPDEIYTCCDESLCEGCIRVCECGENMCNNCSIECERCGKDYCRGCIDKCEICGEDICNECKVGTDCGCTVCENCTISCEVCGEVACEACICRCEICKDWLCSRHVFEARNSEGKYLQVCEGCKDIIEKNNSEDDSEE